LIADLDRSGEGLLTVDNSAMAELSTNLQQRQKSAGVSGGGAP
jgi:hypothetical protein